MRRSTFSRVVLRRPGRLALVAGTAALGIGLLAAPASADPTGTPLAAPVVTPSTTGPVAVGSPMTMTLEPGSAADHVYGYAWTWHPASGAPVFGPLPSCPSKDPAAANGGIHFVCGSSVTIRVSPEEPFSQFSVWAYDATGDASPTARVAVAGPHDVTALYPVTHQWTTDQFWSVPPPASCAVVSVTVDCVPDTAGVDAQHPTGSHPLLLPPGTQWDASGQGVPGVLTFGPASTPAGTLAPVVDTGSSFTAGAWLTPTASPSGTPATALAQEGPAGSGFELGLSGDGHLQFRVHTPAGAASAVNPFTSMPGIAVYVAGVWDSVNKEVRLYVNGSLVSVVGYAPHATKAPDGPVTVGARLSGHGVTENWTGQIGNPVLAQTTLTRDDLGQLSFESFFPGSDSGGNYDLG